MRLKGAEPTPQASCLLPSPSHEQTQGRKPQCTGVARCRWGEPSTGAGHVVFSSLSHPEDSPRVHWECVSSSSPTQPGDCGAFQRHQELQVQEGIVAGPSLPAPAAPALSSLVSRPAQAPGVDGSPASEPSWQHSTADNSHLGFPFFSLFSGRVVDLQGRVSFRMLGCPPAHTHTCSFLDSLLG